VLPKDILLYYAAGIMLALLVIMRRRPRKGMRLRLRGSGGTAKEMGGVEKEPELNGKTPPDKFSHIRPHGERPLNVVFNFNGHSWDAYEVLGLPAGSSIEKVTQAFRNSMQSVDKESQPFLEAAYDAIQTQWSSYRKAGQG
jgi:hypothetical protein